MDEWSQVDMWHMINSTPSRSGMDDDVETIMRIHHRVVAQMQAEYREKFEELQQKTPMFLEQVEFCVPGTSMISAQMMCDEHIGRIMMKHKKMLELSIPAMWGVTRERIQNAMRFHGIEPEQVTDEALVSWE